MRSRGSAPGGSGQSPASPPWPYSTKRHSAKGRILSEIFFLASTRTVIYDVVVLETSAPLLAHRVAAIQAEIRDEAAHHAARAGLVASLHVLILTALARLLACLEQMVELWRSGQLPPKSPTRIASPAAVHAPCVPASGMRLHQAAQFAKRPVRVRAPMAAPPAAARQMSQLGRTWTSILHRHPRPHDAGQRHIAQRHIAQRHIAQRHIAQRRITPTVRVPGPLRFFRPPTPYVEPRPKCFDITIIAISRKTQRK